MQIGDRESSTNTRVAAYTIITEDVDSLRVLALGDGQKSQLQLRLSVAWKLLYQLRQFAARLSRSTLRNQTPCSKQPGLAIVGPEPEDSVGLLHRIGRSLLQETDFRELVTGGHQVVLLGQRLDELDPRPVQVAFEAIGLAQLKKQRSIARILRSQNLEFAHGHICVLAFAAVQQNAGVKMQRLIIRRVFLYNLASQAGGVHLVSLTQKGHHTPFLISDF